MSLIVWNCIHVFLYIAPLMDSLSLFIFLTLSFSVFIQNHWNVFFLLLFWVLLAAFWWKLKRYQTLSLTFINISLCFYIFLTLFSLRFLFPKHWNLLKCFVLDLSAAFWWRLSGYQTHQIHPYSQGTYICRIHIWIRARFAARKCGSGSDLEKNPVLMGNVFMRKQ